MILHLGLKPCILIHPIYNDKIQSREAKGLNPKIISYQMDHETWACIKSNQMITISGTWEIIARIPTMTGCKHHVHMQTFPRI